MDLIIPQTDHLYLLTFPNPPPFYLWLESKASNELLIRNGKIDLAFEFKPRKEKHN